MHKKNNKKLQKTHKKTKISEIKKKKTHKKRFFTSLRSIPLRLLITSGCVFIFHNANCANCAYVQLHNTHRGVPGVEGALGLCPPIADKYTKLLWCKADIHN